MSPDEPRVAFGLKMGMSDLTLARAPNLGNSGKIGEIGVVCIPYSKVIGGRLTPNTNRRGLEPSQATQY